MSSRHRLGSGRRYEDLLNGSRPDDSALSALLDAARAPGTREEMAGLPAARTAFMSVPYVRARPAASVSRLPAATRTAAGRLLALKFVAAVSGVTLVGGAAYAATGAKLLGGGSSPHKHAVSSSAPAPVHHHGGGGIYPAPVGAPPPTPGQPQPRTTNGAGGPRGKSSLARSEHPPSNPATPHGQSKTPRPPATHTSGPPSSHTPGPRHTPTPHNTKPHPSPNPHKSSPGEGQAKLVSPSPSVS
jgi:hypothetical protein